MKTVKLLSFIALFLMLPVAANAAGDAAAGKKKSTVCAGCHGPKGISSNGQWPNLAGQREAYLAKSLSAYQNGDRNDPIMKPMAAALSAVDILDLAAYYASLKP